MINLRLVGWNDIISHLRKVITTFCRHNSIMILRVVIYVKYDHIYLHVSNVKVCVLLLMMLGDHVRLSLCLYVCSLRVDACFFVLDYMSP